MLSSWAQLRCCRILGLLHVRIASVPSAVLGQILAIWLHHEPALDRVQTLSGVRRVPRFTAHGVRRARMEIRRLLLSIDLIIHDDCIHALSWSCTFFFLG